MLALRAHMLLIIIWIIAYVGSSEGKHSVNKKLELYNQSRNALIDSEISMMIGGTLKLSKQEKRANELLMKEKYAEVDAGFIDESKFHPAWHFFDRKEEIEQSPVFKFIRSMPKAAVLHVHDTAMLGHDYIIKNITYRDNLYICDADNTIKLIFSNQKPAADATCNWNLLNDLRVQSGNVEEFDRNLTRHFTIEFLTPEQRVSSYEVWNHFVKIFDVITPLFTYKPVWEDYFYEALKQYKEDNIFYVEIRSSLPPLYNLDGTYMDIIETAKSFKRVNDKFVKDNPDTFGSRIIYTPVRFVTPEGAQEYIDTMFKLQQELGDFAAGFDIVGHEDVGTPLNGFIEQLLQLVGKTNVFYHAGETNWYGLPTDYNLYEAVLLGSKRIGQGFALLKHPAIAKIVKRKNIAVEVSPIANQALGFLDDMRNHPAAVLIAQNYPLVLSNDDGGLWNSLPLSHDFYELFVGIASRQADLKLLKQLAINSIIYSMMPSKEMRKAMQLFKKQWSRFIRNFVKKSCK